MTKEDKAKEYAKNCYPDNEDMRSQCEYHFESGWDEALKSLWIKVEDKLPEVDKYVLILIKYMDEYQIHKYIRFSNDTLETWKFTKDSKIIAWMEIPSYEHIINSK